MSSYSIEHLKKQQELLVNSIENNNYKKSEHILVDHPNLPTDVAIDTYHRDYKQRLLDALGENYPKSKELFKQVFKRHCLEFIDKHKSQSYNLNNFGLKLPDFLQAVSAQQDLIEFCLLEKMITKLYYEKPTPGLSIEQIEKLDLNESSKIGFINNLELFISEFPILHWWQTQTKDNSVGAPPFLLYLNEQGVIFIKLTTAQASTVKNLMNSSPLHEALVEEMSENEVSELFRILNENRLIASIS